MRSGVRRKEAAGRRTGGAAQGEKSRGGRPSVPLDLPKHNPRPKPGELDVVSRGMWLGLGVLIVALILIAVQSTPKAKAPRVTPDLTPTVDGILCGPGDVVTYQAAAHLDLFVRGRRVALGSGIGQYTTSTGACKYTLHTQDGSGVIRIQAAAKADFTLGQFFDIWGMPLSRTVLLGFQTTSTHPAGQVRAFVDGRAYPGDPRAIPLAPHTEITLEYGPPWVAPASSYRFPKGT